MDDAGLGSVPIATSEPGVLECEVVAAVVEVSRLKVDYKSGDDNDEIAVIAEAAEWRSSRFDHDG
jgi:hypothetical protein